MTSYRTCAVPMCGGTTIKYPNKLFIHVPYCPKRRQQWLQLARRDQLGTSAKSPIFFCEDHFNLPSDMENYMQYRVMGSVGNIRMKPDCLPSKFECQPDRRKRTASPQLRSAVSKRQRIIQEILPKETEISGTKFNNDFHSVFLQDDVSLTTFQDKATQVSPETSNQLVQVCLTPQIRSKAIQVATQTKDKNTSPLKTNSNKISTPTATSPFKIREYGVESAKSGKAELQRKLVFCTKNSVSSSSCSSLRKQSQSKPNSSPSVQSLAMTTSTRSDQETQSDLDRIKRKMEAANLCRNSLENTIRFIKNKKK